MGFEGIAMVEYKKTGDGRLILMEINGRPWGSIGLPVACGIDYPRHLIEWSLHGKLPPQEISYQTNVTCRRLVGELTHLSNIRRGRPPTGRAGIRISGPVCSPWQCLGCRACVMTMFGCRTCGPDLPRFATGFGPA